MTFLWPKMLVFLALVPALVFAYLALLRRRRRAALRYASLMVVKEAVGTGPNIRRHVPAALLLASLTIMLLAMARPAAVMWLPSQRETVILVMDVSGSMRAADIEPNRLAAAQEAVISFVNDQPSTTRIGIVAFAGIAQLVQQPTTNREDIISAVRRFQLQRGTNIGGGLLVALQTIFPDADFDLGPRFYIPGQRGAPLGQATPEPEPFVPVEPGSHENAVIVLLTDGQPTTGPDPIEVARRAADRGVRIYTVGFGSREGQVVGFGGMSMRVQLDEELLRQIAEITRARYFHAGDANDLKEVYRSLTSQFGLERQETEITAIFAGVAVGLLILSVTLSMLWFGRIA